LDTKDKFFKALLQNATVKVNYLCPILMKAEIFRFLLFI